MTYNSWRATKAFTMHSIKIHTFNPSKPCADREFYIYILSKGLNSGKPLEHPCPNCFVLECNSQSENVFYHSLLFGLWKIKYFHPYLTGSVIPFLRLSDLKSILIDKQEKLECSMDSFYSDVIKIKVLDAQQEKLEKTIALIKELKFSMICRHLLPNS